MSLFQRKNSFDIDPFTDLLFNVLLTFTFLFLIALLLLNPPAKSGIIDPKAEFIVTVSWPDGDPNDIDVWATGPEGAKVWYKKTQDGLMHLDRDDRGLANDTQTVNGREIINPLNQEVLTIRGRPPGEFIVNVHYFKSETKKEIPVTVYLAEVNPVMKVLNYHTTVLSEEGEEVTAVRFTITPAGEVININRLQKSLVKAISK
ncbi:hypothetical protein [Neptuniibacter pectenicola]|uniref:hypothetical protein n=1 Tax=Neptuniibacter pectenicola TaxID=1806669 RepID=UPI0007996B94|nr:hypothetical protein [Neptuniibacter pectenicola]KXJ53028.1 MAG: hypothetical protein AXW15_03230 [Neptuniibacter sp. Phe_28]